MCVRLYARLVESVLVFTCVSALPQSYDLFIDKVSRPGQVGIGYLGSNMPPDELKLGSALLVPYQWAPLSPRLPVAPVHVVNLSAGTLAKGGAHTEL